MLAELTYNMPVFSAVLLLVAGALVGYALTYPYRGETRQISRQLNELVDQNDDLHDELQQQRSAYDRLERKYKDQETEWNRFRASSESLKETLLSKERSTSSLENAAGLRDLRESSIRELVDLKTEKAELSLQLANKEELLNTANRNLAELRGELDELRKLQRGQYDASDKMADLIQQIEQQRTRYDELQQEYHTTQQEYHATQQELDSVQVEYEAVQQEYDTIQTDYASVMEEHQSLISTVEERQATRDTEVQTQVTEMRDRLAAFAERLQIAEAEKDEVYQRWDNEHHQRLALDNMLRHKEQLIANFEKKLESSIEHRTASDQLKEEYDALRIQVSELTAERNALVQLVDAREQQLADANKDVEDHRRALDTIERHRVDAVGSLEQLENSNDQLRADAEKYQQRLARVQTELEDRNRQLNKAVEEKQLVLERFEEAEELWEDLVAEQVNLVPVEQHENVVQQLRVVHETMERQRGELQTQAQLLVNLTQERDDALTSVIKIRESAVDAERQREVEVRDIRESEKQARLRTEQINEQEKSRILAELQKVQSAMVAEREKMEDEIGDLQNELAKKDAELLSTQDKLTQTSVEMEQQLEVMRAEEREAHGVATAELMGELQKVQALLKNHEGTLEHQASRLVEMAEYEEATVATINQLQTELATSEAQREALATEARSAQQTVAELQSELQDQQHLVTRFDSERSARLAEEQQRTALETEIEQAQRMSAQLQSELEEQNHRMKQLRIDGDEAITAAAAARDEVARVKSELDESYQESQRIRDQREEVLDELRRSQELNLRLQAQIDEQQQTYAETARQLSALQPIQSDMESVQHRLESSIAQLNDVQRERDLAVEARARLEVTVEDIRSELRKSNDMIVELRQDQVEHSEFERELEMARTELAQFKPTVAELHKQLRQREERMAAYVEERTAEEVALRSQLAEARDRQLEQQQKIDQLQLRLDNGHETASHLQRDREEVLTQLRRENNHLAEVDVDAMQRDERRGMVYIQRPRNVDDLKLISGVAEVLEEKLNEYGIYTYEQIMNWDAVAVAEFSRLLSFRDRIERDDWIGQARTFYAGKDQSDARKSA